MSRSEFHDWECQIEEAVKAGDYETVMKYVDDIYKTGYARGKNRADVEIESDKDESLLEGLSVIKEGFPLATERILSEYKDTLYAGANHDIFLYNKSDNSLIKVNEISGSLKKQKRTTEDLGRIRDINETLDFLTESVRTYFGLKPTREERRLMQEEINKAVQDRIANSKTRYADMTFDDIINEVRENNLKYKKGNEEPESLGEYSEPGEPIEFDDEEEMEM